MLGYSTKAVEKAARTRSGEADPMKLRTTKSKEQGRGGSDLPRCTPKVSLKEKTAAATSKNKAGKGHTVKEGSTKRKAAAGSSKGKKAAAGTATADDTAGFSRGKKVATAPPAAAEAAATGGVSDGPKDAADVAVATADTGDKVWVPGQPLELPKKYVDWILAQKRHVLEEDPDEYYNRMINDPDRLDIFTPEFLEEERQLMRDMAELYRINGDKLEKFQDWVRIQLQIKGRVLVDDTYLANRIAFREAFAEEFGEAFAEGFGNLWRDE